MRYVLVLRIELILLQLYVMELIAFSNQNIVIEAAEGDASAVVLVRTSARRKVVPRFLDLRDSTQYSTGRAGGDFLCISGRDGECEDVHMFRLRGYRLLM